jgi:hypothetical protein
MKKVVRKHHTYDLSNGTVDVTIEVKLYLTYLDKEVRFQLKQDVINPKFEGWIEGQIVQIPVSKEDIGEFELPESVSPYTRDRIRDGINSFLDAMYA